MRAWVCLYAAVRPPGHQSLQFLLLLYTQTDPVPLRWHPHPPNITLAFDVSRQPYGLLSIILKLLHY